MAKKQCTCTICGSQFKPKRNSPNKFCGAACYHAAQRRGEYNRGSKLVASCTHCGELVVGKSKGRSRSGKKSESLFCNRSCYDKYRAAAILKERKSTCTHCGNAFIRLHDGSGKFCSMACRTEHKRPSPINCVNCGCWFSAIKPIRRKAGIQLCAVSAAKTCSPDCWTEWRSRNPERRRKISAAFSGDKHPNWQGGSHHGDSRGSGWHRIAEKCRDLHRRQCKHCGMSEGDSVSRGWGRLQVNHIVPFHQWRNKRKANAQSNLEALCKSCHTKADWKWRKENAVQMSLSIFK